MYFCFSNCKIINPQCNMLLSLRAVRYVFACHASVFVKVKLCGYFCVLLMTTTMIIKMVIVMLTIAETAQVSEETTIRMSVCSFVSSSKLKIRLQLKERLIILTHPGRGSCSNKHNYLQLDARNTEANPKPRLHPVMHDFRHVNASQGAPAAQPHTQSPPQRLAATPLSLCGDPRKREERKSTEFSAESPSVNLV